MAWIQIGKNKINIDLICYSELEGDTVRIWFTGHPNVLEYHFDEAKALWKAIKADTVLGAAEDKGFKTLTKKDSTNTYDVGTDKTLVVEKPKPPQSSPHAVQLGQRTPQTPAPQASPPPTRR